MAKVWIVKEQMLGSRLNSEPMDYTPAMKFGDLEFITTYDLPLHPGSTIKERWMQDVFKFVNSFNPEDDYIVCTGQPIAIFMIGFLLGYLTAGQKWKVQFLVWRREENRYIVTSLYQ